MAKKKGFLDVGKSMSNAFIGQTPKQLPKKVRQGLRATVQSFKGAGGSEGNSSTGGNFVAKPKGPKAIVGQVPKFKLTPKQKSQAGAIKQSFKGAGGSNESGNTYRKTKSKKKGK